MEQLSKNNNDGSMLDQNNIDAYHEKPEEKSIFIDRLVKLALEDRIFTDQNVLDELKTILLSVCNFTHFTHSRTFYKLVSLFVGF